MSQEVNWDGVFSYFSSHMQRTAGYLARQEIERLREAYRQDPTRLEPFGFKVYSRGDEDGIIEEIFRRLAIKQGVFCEIGVENGLECNSLWLLHKGWRGVWVEGNTIQQQAIETKFASLIEANRLQLCIGMVTAENINELLEHKSFHLDEIDFLSIDIDGNDIYLFEALACKPKVICIEYNAKFPPSACVQQLYNPERAWGGTDYMGSNLQALVQVACRKGYQLVGTDITGSNAFFVREDLIAPAVWPEPSAEKLHNPARYWLIADHFQHVGHMADFGPYAGLDKISL